MRDLQHVYEQILGVSLDRRNFRKKIFSTGLLKDEEEMEQKVNHRPGKLFSFSSETYEQIKRNPTSVFVFDQFSILASSQLLEQVKIFIDFQWFIRLSFKKAPFLFVLELNSPSFALPFGRMGCFRDGGNRF